MEQSKSWGSDKQDIVVTFKIEKNNCSKLKLRLIPNSNIRSFIDKASLDYRLEAEFTPNQRDGYQSFRVQSIPNATYIFKKEDFKIEIILKEK